MYRPNKGSFSIDNFDPSLCTHAVYAFSGLDVPTDSIKSMGNFSIQSNYANIFAMNE